MQRIIKRFGIMLLMVVAAAIASILLLTLIKLIPNKLIDKHAKESIAVFTEEGSGPSTSEHFESVRDNDTDAEMIYISSNQGESALEEALLVNWQEANAVTVLKNKYAESPVEYTTVPYGRYWHGYQLWLRPLLVVFNYSEIRVLGLLLMLASIIGVVYLLIQRGAMTAVIPYGITVLLLVPTSIYKCMTFGFCFFVCQLALLVYLAKYEYFEEDNRFLYLCLFTGILTNFFDLMTYPMYTLGMLLCIRMMLIKPDLKKEFIDSIGHCFAWGFGYAFMWFLKWVAVSVLTDFNMFADALGNAAYRTGTGEVGRFGAYRANLNYFYGNKAALYLMLIYIIVALSIKLFKRQLNIRDLIVFGIIASIPFAWFTFANEQTWWHAFFTCKALAVSSMAVMCMSTYSKRV